MGKVVAGVGGAIAIWQIIMLFSLGKALKSMWILIDALQFLVYISMWTIAYPTLVRITLSELRSAALGEFFDGIDFGMYISDFFGIDF